MNKFIWIKTIVALVILTIIGIYTYKNLNKPSDQETIMPITTDSIKEATKKNTSNAVIENSAPVESIPVKIPSGNPGEKDEQSRFLAQSSADTLASFEIEPLSDAGWAYTQEQLIHNMITQEIYPNEVIKVAKEIKVKCKSETCLLTTKLESFEQVEEFYSALMKYGQGKGYQFNPVKMSPGETIFAIYPPTSQ